ncbi:MAG: hypothetical protein K6G24_04430 [Lachnospiraceae bacterium]|nr:hypothetical protein [Lachnospiraceae bacterium]
MDLKITSAYDNSIVYPLNKSEIGNPVEKVAPVTRTEIEKPAAIYEKSEKNDLQPTYSINKMSKEDRASLVTQMKSDLEKKQNQLTDIVSSLMSGQANTLAKTDDIWSFLSKGNFTVTEAARAQAQEDISENGYWGVAQTSQRVFDFASALAGDDEEKMRQMESAMEKGFGQAMNAWGNELPQLSQDTMASARDLFNEFYANKSKEVDVAVAV